MQHRSKKNDLGRKLGGLVVSLALFFSVGISTIHAEEAQDERIHKLEEAVEQLNKQNSTLQQRVQELEGKTKAVPSTPSAPPTAATASSGTSREKKLADEPVRWNELVMGNSKLKFYGFLRLDAIYDDSRPNNTQIPGFIRSEDPRAPSTVATGANDDDFTLHPRLTRFGIDFDGPRIEPLGNPKVGGKLEVDFYNLPSSESRNAPRMRHAYLKLGWNEASILAGQTSDVISPIFPIVNPDFVMWGAGNLGDRRPQLRGEFTPKLGPGKMISQLEIGLTGADDAQDLDPTATSGFRDGEASGVPTLQGRLAYRFPNWDKQNIELGVWGHLASERTDSPIGTSTRREFDSEAVGIDLTLPIYKDMVWLKGEAWTGKNLDDVRGGILQGINSTTGNEVSTQGGWFELGWRPSKWYSLHAGYSFDDPDNADLIGATTPGRAANHIWYSAVRGYFDPIEIGMDYLNWKTEFIGFENGEDNRIQWFISYKF